MKGYNIMITEKLTQKEINETAENIFRKAMKEFYVSDRPYWERLRTCSAYVYDTGNYILLRSYNTIIAAIDKTTNITVDMLRHEYGYTSTSAQHLAKFRHDYTPYPWNYPVYTWRSLSK
jgi:hypothetical protein